MTLRKLRGLPKGKPKRPPYAYHHLEKIGIGAYENIPLNTMLNEVESVLGGSTPGWYQTFDNTDIVDPTPPATRTVKWYPRLIYANRNGSLPSTKTVLLTFNEPDRAAQDNISPATALAAWSIMEAHRAAGWPIASPACDKGETVGAGTWLDDFMAGTPEVDYIDFHAYIGSNGATGNAAVALLENYINDVWDAYGLPIILSEWGLVDWGDTARFTMAQTVDFASRAMQMMDANDHVAFHAQFVANVWTDDIKTQWLNAAGAETDMARLYRTVKGTA